MNRRRFLALSATCLISPRAARASGTWRGIALGADAVIHLSGPSAKINQAFASLPALLNEVEDEFSLYRPTSALSRLNQSGRLAPSPHFAKICQISDQLHRKTGGSFDPTVQPLWKALAKGGDLAIARRAIGWDRVTFADEIRLDRGQALTFNGIAQGFATDLLRRHLQDLGFAVGLVNIGEFAALGGPHPVGIADPVAGVLAQVRLTNTAMAVSSPRATLIAGEPHILHPKGLPPLWSTVAVEADSAAVADGLSTALVFARREEILKIRQAIGGIGRIYGVDLSGNLEGFLS